MGISISLKKFGRSTEAIWQQIIGGALPEPARSDFAAQLGYLENAGSPVGSVTPDFIGQRCLDTTNGLLYTAVGATNADWQGGGSQRVATTLTSATNNLTVGMLGQVVPYNNGTGGAQTLPDAATAWAAMPFGMIVLHIKGAGVPTFAAAGSDSLRLSASGARYGMLAAQIISATEWAQFASGA